MSQSILENSYHRTVQNKILFFYNIIFFCFVAILGISSFLAKEVGEAQIAVMLCFFIILSIFLQRMNYYVASSYITIIGTNIAAILTLFTTSPQEYLYMYRYGLFCSIPILIASILSIHRQSTWLLGIINLSVFFLYIVNIHIPIFGMAHMKSIIDIVIAMLALIVLADQIYGLSGEINRRFEEIEHDSDIQKNNLRTIGELTNSSKQNSSSFEKQTIENENITIELQDSIQIFNDSMHNLEVLLKDFFMRNDSIIGSTENILQVFKKHRVGMEQYKIKVDNISETSQDIDFITQSKHSQMAELIEVSRQGKNYMQDSVNAVEKVAENSKNMLELISLIMEVAERTNVLALNAAIEASRAGKAGGGFAIVAKEIKKLSTETTQNADTINRTLRTNIKSIEEAVEIIHNAGHALSAINSNITDFSGAIEEIVQRVNGLSEQNFQMSIDTKNIILLIDEVESILDKTLGNIQQGNIKVQDLQSLYEVLSKNIKHIHSQANTLRSTGRKTQESYREYSYSVERVGEIITELQIKQQL